MESAQRGVGRRFAEQVVVSKGWLSVTQASNALTYWHDGGRESFRTPETSRWVVAGPERANELRPLKERGFGADFRKRRLRGLTNGLCG